MPLVPERVGPYEVLRPLGAGGMGMVYEARHPRLPRAVAVKVILASRAGERALARFWREAQALAKVRHPGVVAIHELGQSAEGPFIVSELISGRSFREVSEEGPDAATCARLMRDLAQALGAVHAAGILHRDLKPANVLVRDDGRPVLLDFGLARDVDAETLTRTGELLGTPAFMAPEQARGLTSSLDERTDIYGLGTLLYCLLAGHPPFEGPALQAMAQVVASDPEWPSAARPETSPGLEAICKKCMAKDPAARYPSAPALEADLSRVLAGEPPLALAEQVARRRRRLLALLAPLVALALGGALAVGFVQGWRAEVGGVGATSGREVAERGPAAPAQPAPVVSSTPVLEPVWSLSAAETLRYRFAYEETNDTLLTSLGGEVRSRGIVPEGDEVQVVFEAVALEGNLSAVAGGFGGGGTPFSTRDERPDPTHPFYLLTKVVGQTFQCRLKPATGAVKSVRGFADILASLGAPKAIPKPSAGSWGAQLGLDPQLAVRSFLNDDFIRKSFDSVARVRGAGGAALPWQVQGDACVVSTQREGPVLPRLMNLDVLPRKARYEVRGTSRYEAGRLRRGELSQQLVGVAGKVHRAAWSWSLLDD